MTVPQSLKKVEKEISEELKEANLPVHFEIINYDPKTEAIEHNVSCLDPTKKVPDKAWKIINEHTEKWRKSSKNPTNLAHVQ